MPDDEAKTISVFLEDDPVIGMDPKHVKFVDMLLFFKGDKGKAYKSAGYKVKSHDIARRNASRLLKNARIQRLLAHRIEKARQAANLEVKQARVIQELNWLAHSNIVDLVSWDSDGALNYKASDELPLHVQRSIKKIKVNETIIPQEGGDPIVRRSIEIEQHDKKGPLTLLAQASKLVSDTKPAAKVNMTFNLGSHTSGSREKNKAERVVSDQ